MVKAKPGSYRLTMKGYVAVFICTVTRAIHLEPVSSLTTGAFLAAFDCFKGRRGAVDEMRSDNGTTFLGATNEMKLIRAS